MRGKGSRTFIEPSLFRITPAHAGKSRNHGGTRSGCGDHPRACGEKLAEAMQARNIRGSPPRMRGKVHGLAIGAVGVGITPAHAGKSSWYKVESYDLQDHPRACGEKPPLLCFFSLVLGSPPRMRGKEFFVQDCLLSDGITPAHAGKRKAHHRRRRVRWDHPRACGEKEFNG